MEIKSYIVDLICFFCFFDSLQAKAYWETLLGFWEVAPCKDLQVIIERLLNLLTRNEKPERFSYK